MLWIFRHVWWQWDPATADVFSAIYHWFNLAECAIWLVCGVIVAHRGLRSRKSTLESPYSAAFVVFGLTDALEAWQQSTPLILIKLVNLTLLFVLRRRVMCLYPEARLL